MELCGFAWELSTPDGLCCACMRNKWVFKKKIKCHSFNFVFLESSEKQKCVNSNI